MGTRPQGGRRERRAFGAEFKVEAARMVQERVAGVSLAQIGQELNVTPDQLRGCMRARCRRRELFGPHAQLVGPDIQLPADLRQRSSRRPPLLHQVHRFRLELGTERATFTPASHLL